MSEPLKVLHFPEAHDGCTWYRQRVWLNALKDNSSVQFRPMPQDGTQAEYIQLIKDCDVYFMRGIGASVANEVDFVRQINPKCAIVFDTDDDLFTPSPLSGAYQTIGQHEIQGPDGKMLYKHSVNGFDLHKNWLNLTHYRWCLHEADVLTTTTERLAQQLRDYNDTVAIIPNGILPEYFPEAHPQHPKGETHLAWAGGNSHFEDLKLIQPALQELMKDKSIHLHVIGQVFKGFTNALPEIQVHIHPWVDPTGHGFHLATIPADIGLCPLTDAEFNKAKSCIKWYEYSALGWATVASNVPPYSDEIISNQNGLLASPEQWIQAIKVLVNDPIQRSNMATNAREWVLKNRNAHELAKDWLEVLTAAAEARKSA